MLAVALCCSVAPHSRAQSYPVKPVRLVVGFVPGGGADVSGRIIAQKLSGELGQPVLVENRPGAGSAIATELVAAAAPDGHTLLLMASSGVLQFALRPNSTVQLERDLAPISLVADGNFALVVHPSVPARTVRELIALVRAHPGRLNYSSAGVGTASHLAGALFASTAGLQLVHVPFKGGGESVVAVAGGQIELSFPTVTAALPLLHSGKLRSLAVTSAKRASLLPTVPTLSESGMPGYDHTIWYGVMGPKALSRDIIMRLAAVLSKTLGSEDIKESLTKQGLEARTSTPAEFTAFLKREMTLNAKLVALTGAKPE